MKRPVFFLIAAILAFVFGVMMFLSPSRASEGFGIVSAPATNNLFRALGAMILSTGLMNFLVRKHDDNLTLKAVLITNVVTHALSMISDLWALADGVLQIVNVVPGQLTHLFVGVGSLIYWMKMKSLK